MESHLREATLWANELAARLRLLQANCADDPAANRKSYLTEEIDRALKGIVISNRKVYLDALAEQFPSWQSSPSPVADRKTGTAPETPESLLERFISLASELPAESKTAFARKLQQAGLAVKEQTEASIQLAPEVQKKLGLSPGQPLNLERAVKLLAGVSDFILALDQLSWALWKQLAPRSQIRKEADFGKLASQYLGGDPEISVQQATQPLERTRRLIAGLLGSVGRAGSAYAKKHAARFAPEEIKILAEMEKGWTGLEQKCWRKYEELFRDHATEPAIENEIQDAIAKAAENLIMGRAAS